MAMRLPYLSVLVLAASSLVGAAGGASALQMKVIPGPEPTVSILELSGRFELGDGLKFRAEINKIPQEHRVIIHLRSSGGGFTNEAMSIGRLIHRLGMGTVVPPSASCTSPCPLTFVAGFDRRRNEPSMIKHSTGSLGVTSGPSVERKDQDYTYKDLDAVIADRQKYTLQAADYLQELGVDIDFLKFYLKPLPGKTSQISNEELLDIGGSIFDDSNNQLVDGMSLRRRRQ